MALSGFLASLSQAGARLCAAGFALQLWANCWTGSICLRDGGALAMGERVRLALIYSSSHVVSRCRLQSDRIRRIHMIPSERKRLAILEARAMKPSPHRFRPPFEVGLLQQGRCNKLAIVAIAGQTIAVTTNSRSCLARPPRTRGHHELRRQFAIV